MELFNRIGRVIRSEIRYSESDPETLLEQLVLDMQEDLVQLRLAVVSAVARSKLNNSIIKPKMKSASGKAMSSWLCKKVMRIWHVKR